MKHSIAITMPLVFLLSGPLLFAQKPEVKIRKLTATAQVIIGLAENANLANPFDSVTKDTTFTYKVTFLPPGEQVQSDFVFDATTKNGRNIALRLVRPGSGFADFTAGRIELDLVFELTLQGKKFQIPVRWTTGRITDAFGSDQGSVSNVNPETETAQVRLVGTGTFVASAKDFSPEATENKTLNFVIRLIAQGQLGPG